MVNEGNVVADEGNVQVFEDDNSVPDVLGDVFLKELFEDDVFEDVQLIKVARDVVNDMANNVIVFKSNGFENLLIHGGATFQLLL